MAESGERDQALVILDNTFKCIPYKTKLTVAACASRWKEANAEGGRLAPTPTRMMQIEHCQNCDVGEKNAAEQKSVKGVSEARTGEEYAEPVPRSKKTIEKEDLEAEARWQAAGGKQTLHVDDDEDEDEQGEEEMAKVKTCSVCKRPNKRLPKTGVCRSKDCQAAAAAAAGGRASGKTATRQKFPPKASKAPVAADDLTENVLKFISLRMELRRLKIELDQFVLDNPEVKAEVERILGGDDGDV